jgi:hypothetical protein
LNGDRKEKKTTTTIGISKNDPDLTIAPVTTTTKNTTLTTVMANNKSTLASLDVKPKQVKKIKTNDLITTPDLNKVKKVDELPSSYTYSVTSIDKMHMKSQPIPTLGLTSILYGSGIVVDRDDIIDSGRKSKPNSSRNPPTSLSNLNTHQQSHADMDVDTNPNPRLSLLRITINKLRDNMKSQTKLNDIDDEDSQPSQSARVIHKPQDHFNPPTHDIDPTVKLDMPSLKLSGYELITSTVL